MVTTVYGNHEAKSSLKYKTLVFNHLFAGDGLSAGLAWQCCEKNHGLAGGERAWKGRR
jgi:hypothetical protein